MKKTLHKAASFFFMNSPPCVPPLCFAERGKFYIFSVWNKLAPMSFSKRFNFERIKLHVRELRRNLTPAEKVLWQELRNRRLSGYKFLRQHPILYRGNLIRYNYFVADFYCHEKRLILELDGSIHDTSEDYDRFRESELQEIGFHIMRIRNEELVNMKKVLQKISDFLSSN